MFEIELAQKGGAPLFRPFHILKAMWHLQVSGTMGRKELSERLSIGEGSTRKLLSYLEEKEWARSTRQGISLIQGGCELLDEIGFAASEVQAGELTVGDHDFAIRLRGVSSIVEKGIEQRDEAMKAGASGASTLLLMNGLHFSDGYDASSVDQDACRHVIESFSLKEGDVIIIGSSFDADSSKDGAFAAAVLTLNKM